MHLVSAPSEAADCDIPVLRMGRLCRRADWLCWAGWSPVGNSLTRQALIRWLIHRYCRCPWLAGSSPEADCFKNCQCALSIKRCSNTTYIAVRAVIVYGSFISSNLEDKVQLRKAFEQGLDDIIVAWCTCRPGLRTHDCLGWYAEIEAVGRKASGGCRGRAGSNSSITRHRSSNTRESLSLLESAKYICQGNALQKIICYPEVARLIRRYKASLLMLWCCRRSVNLQDSPSLFLNHSIYNCCDGCIVEGDTALPVKEGRPVFLQVNHWNLTHDDDGRWILIENEVDNLNEVRRRIRYLVTEQHIPCASHQKDDLLLEWYVRRHIQIIVKPGKVCVWIALVFQVAKILCALRTDESTSHSPTGYETVIS